MNTLSRRSFVKYAGVAGIVSLSGLPLRSYSKTARVVIIGGGFGGASCASYLKHFDPNLDVTLIEPFKTFVTCPFSNTVIAGMHDMKFISHSYDALRDNRKVKVVHDTVTAVDSISQSVSLSGGGKLKYDRLVVSPGIGFRYNLIKGYDESSAKVMPHAWKAGEQTALLRKRIEAMDDGGVVVIAPPPEPFRAPPAPYERASLIAHYLKKTKPKSKILIVDSNKKFAKQHLFEAGWKKLYPGMIDWISGDEVGSINRVDAKAMQIFSSSGKSFKGTVINLIPPQSANKIAVSAGLTDKKGWCPVNQKTFESLKQKKIYVLGDACMAGDMPKTGHSANAQAKVCAATIVSELHGEKMPEIVLSSSIYSMVSPKYAISMASVYRVKNKRITKVSGGDSAEKASKKIRLKEAKYALGWYKAIVADVLGG